MTVLTMFFALKYELDFAAKLSKDFPVVITQRIGHCSGNVCIFNRTILVLCLYIYSVECWTYLRRYFQPGSRPDVQVGIKSLIIQVIYLVWMLWEMALYYIGVPTEIILPTATTYIHNTIKIAYNCYTPPFSWTINMVP